MAAPGQTRNAVVTGATGYIGSHLVKRLLRDGWRVTALVRPSSDLRCFNDMHGELSLSTHDGTTEQLRELLSAAAPDIVFHLAAYYRAEHQAVDVLPMLQANVVFATQLADAMASCGVKRLVNTATAWQHYDDADYNPVNLYAASKQAFESLLQFYVEAHAFQVISLTLFDTYGPNDPRKKLIQTLLSQPPNATPLELSPGDQQLELVHVDDVVAAFLVAALRLRQGSVSGHERYLLRSTSSIMLKDLVSLIEQITGRTIPVRWGAKPYRRREMLLPWSGGRPLPRWQPSIDLARGIRDCFLHRTRRLESFG
jgi:nucleoside-diphosphate-sugar epimerase